jgi:hypothetical protein
MPTGMAESITDAQRVDLYNTIVHEKFHYAKQYFCERNFHSNENAARAAGNTAAARDKDDIMSGKLCGCRKK